MHAVPGRWCALICALFLFAAPAHANPKYAGIVYDVTTGKTLYGENADAKRYPASLTKVMTLYIVFEELAARRLKFGDPITVSKYAAGRPPSKIGFKPGQTIAVRDAIKALVTKSANDVASAVAEHIGGTEGKFAKRMTRTARRLGMKSTTFRNASGLPNRAQTTTARDMARLGLAIQRDFPQYYGVFQTRTFQFGKRRYRNHNRLLGRVTGVDGIKTGFIRASGFNLITSVRRDKRHIVAVVMGGRSGKRRNAQMASLVERYLPKAKRGRISRVVAWSDRNLMPVPSAKPAVETLVASRLERSREDGIGDQILAFASSVRATAPEGADELTNVIAAATNAGVSAPVASTAGVPAEAVKSFSAVPSPTPLGAPVKVAVAPTGPASATGVTAAAPLHRRQLDDPPKTATPDTPEKAEDRLGAPRSFAAARKADRPATAVSTPAVVAPAVATPALAKAQDRFDAAFAIQTRVTGAFDTFGQAEPRTLNLASLQEAIGRAQQTPTVAPPPALATAPAVPAAVRADWQIQVGAVGSKAEAKELLASAADMVPGLSDQPQVTTRVTTAGGTLYRARFAGFQSHRAAEEACKRFANHDRPCWAVSM
ncbi:MAG: serine hydrolase [Pseudomonadota bacterium]